VTLKDSAANTIFSHDNILGAFAASSIESGRLIGETIDYMFSTLPSSEWVFANGKTIGSANSGGTARASDSADTLTLYSGLWNTFANTEIIIQDSAGSNTTRGVSASADFAANKRLPLPDLCGRMRAGLDTMGAISSKNRLTGLSDGVNGDTPGATGGLESTTIAQANLPNVSLSSASLTVSGTNTAVNGLTGGAGGSGSYSGSNGTGSGVSQTPTWSGSVAGTVPLGGSGTAINNLPPTFIVPSVIIYAGSA
jgi:hypothetical protein